MSQQYIFLPYIVFILLIQNEECFHKGAYYYFALGFIQGNQTLNQTDIMTVHSVGFTTYNQMDATTAMGHKDAQKIALGIELFCL